MLNKSEAMTNGTSMDCGVVRILHESPLERFVWRQSRDATHTLDIYKALCLPVYLLLSFYLSGGFKGLYDVCFYLGQPQLDGYIYIYIYDASSHSHNSAALIGHSRLAHTSCDNLVLKGCCIPCTEKNYILLLGNSEQR